MVRLLVSTQSKIGSSHKIEKTFLSLGYMCRLCYQELSKNSMVAIQLIPKSIGMLPNMKCPCGYVIKKCYMEITSKNIPDTKFYLCSKCAFNFEPYFEDREKFKIEFVRAKIQEKSGKYYIPGQDPFDVHTAYKFIKHLKKHSKEYNDHDDTAIHKFVDDFMNTNISPFMLENHISNITAYFDNNGPCICGSIDVTYHAFISLRDNLNNYPNLTSEDHQKLHFACCEPCFISLRKYDVFKLFTPLAFCKSHKDKYATLHTAVMTSCNRDHDSIKFLYSHFTRKPSKFSPLSL